jgi:hypothetical protein
MKTRNSILKLAAALAISISAVVSVPVAAAHADQRCKDAPIVMGPFTQNAHVCDNGNGTVTSCYSGALVQFGGNCRDWPESSLPPGFWNN